MSAKVGPEEQKRVARIGLVVHAGAARQPTRIINTIQEGDGHPPKDEIRMGHKVRYALEHAPRLQDERREGDLGEVHADSADGCATHEGCMWTVGSGRVGE